MIEKTNINAKPSGISDKYYRGLGIFVMLFITGLSIWAFPYMFHLSEKRMQIYPLSKISVIAAPIFLMGLGLLLGGKKFVPVIEFRSKYKWNLPRILFWLLLASSSLLTEWWMFTITKQI
jgi:hypothetical protein